MTTRCLSATDFAAPIDDRWFEDYVTGSVYEYGHVSPTEQSIVEFALAYDPQPIHIDPVAAAAGPFGGLIASGWHTAGLATRLFVDHVVSRVASMASPGMDEIRWPHPVRAGDELRLRVEIGETRVTRSDPTRGLVHTAITLLNGDDAVVMSMKAMNFMRLRPA